MLVHALKTLKQIPVYKYGQRDRVGNVPFFRSHSTNGRKQKHKNRTTTLSNNRVKAKSQCFQEGQAPKWNQVPTKPTAGRRSTVSASRPCWPTQMFSLLLTGDLCSGWVELCWELCEVKTTINDTGRYWESCWESEEVQQMLSLRKIPRGPVQFVQRKPAQERARDVVIWTHLKPSR